MSDGEGQPGEPLLRLAEGLADARARLAALEATTSARTSSVDAFRVGTEGHLDSQDAALAEVRRTLDGLLQQAQREEQQRTRIADEQERARELAHLGQRETMARISQSAISMGLALCATLLGLLAASWSPRERGAIFAGALGVVVLILAIQWWGNRAPRS